MNFSIINSILPNVIIKIKILIHKFKKIYPLIGPKYFLALYINFSLKRLKDCQDVKFN